MPKRGAPMLSPWNAKKKEARTRQFLLSYTAMGDSETRFIANIILLPSKTE
jgi:hypothetical protein